MRKILFLKGLPASGKSTFAKGLVAKEPDKWVRVNKDDFRYMLHDRKWSKGREKTVEAVQLSVARSALDRGQNVIVDNTHMSPRHENVWKDLAKEFKAEFEVKEFNTSVEECLERDQKRGVPVGAVGKDVILRMFYQHSCLPPPEPVAGRQIVIVVDIDGTLALMKDRSAYEWEKVGNDELNQPVSQAINALRAMGNAVILLSGRDGSCRKQTEEWLERHRIDYKELFMRPTGSMEKDTIVKLKLYEDHVKDKYSVLCVFDDRPCMVRLWRGLGLFCFDCGNGIEF